MTRIPTNDSNVRAGHPRSLATACGVLVAGPRRRASWQVVAWAAGPLGPRQAAAGRGGGEGGNRVTGQGAAD